MRTLGLLVLGLLATGCGSKRALVNAVNADDVARVDSIVGGAPNELVSHDELLVPVAKISPLMLAALWGSPNVTAKLLERGGDPNVADERGWTAFHYAMRPFYRADAAKKREVVRMLVAKGADASRVTKDGDTWPLILHPPHRR